MKKFWISATSIFLIWSVVWIIGIKYQLGSGTSSSRWVFDAYQHKIHAAQQASGPRVLIVAGSNAMFGIDSGMLEQDWQRPVINLGVNAGLGLPYILDVSKRVARPGDIILMPMEYALYLDEGKANAQVIDYVMGRDLDYWRSLDRTGQLKFAAGLSAERLLNGLRHLPDLPVTNGTYGAHHLDARGDQTHTSPAERSPGDIAAVKAAKAWNYGRRADTETGGWSSIADYALWAKNQQICLIAVPTVLLHHAKYDTDPEDQVFYTQLPNRLKQLGLEFLGKPQDFMYPPGWFFDTDHHLQDWARSKHTARLIQLLHSRPQTACGH
ncbi:hypothetical protein H8L32_22730 [Undibacterium sp. CY18W]|uniref:Uncharacterized protein n=1 Tax=Undibacterium hunanense TaxID=2762292 RepID=A0ABR6ZWP9_9BURK|nr:hypothetical protein [Undibacterium hunanense]MBC3920298.1 hypothetical protein [Undibacterium hunanense]